MRRFLLALATAALVSACSQTASDSPTEATTGDAAAEAAHAHNDQDIAFVTGMIPHHRQAVEMAELATSRAERPELKQLAQDIIDSQNAEIQQMEGWLRDWGEPLPAEGDQGEGGHGGGHGQGGDAMSGMMTEGQMADLQSADGADFDRMFLGMMIAHHQGAITMAETELDKGSAQDVKDLAEAIRAAQQREIEQMQGWQQAWGFAAG